MSARDTARAIILSRSLRSAFLLSLSRSAGIDEYAVSIAMSFASAKLTLINCNSCSILSSVWSDKSFPKSVNGYDYMHSTLVKQRRTPHNPGNYHRVLPGTEYAKLPEDVLQLRCERDNGDSKLNRAPFGDEASDRHDCGSGNINRLMA